MSDVKRLSSTNPFLYEDGSLVEADVLFNASIEKAETPNMETSSSEEHANEVGSTDQEQTSQVVVPARQVWASTRTGAVSMDVDDEKIHTMAGSYSEILERPLIPMSIVEETKAELIKDEEEEIVHTQEKEVDEVLTPVNADVDPIQAFLSQERLSDFIARNDEQGAPEYEAGHTDGQPWMLCPAQCSSEEAEHLLQGSGQVTREGDIISYVADDLQSKIKLSSPISKTAVSFSGSRSSTPASLLRTALVSQAQTLDPTIINDIEAHARHIATSVDTLIENLTGTLHSISSLTVDCVETYRDAVCKTCDAVDANIKSTYQLMAKCEELSKSMKPVYKLHEQIKEVKRLLDLFENVVQSTAS